MAHTTVTHKANSEGSVFQNGLMATPDNASDEGVAAILGDLSLGLVADTATFFNALENRFPVERSDDLVIRLDDFHIQTPFT